MLRAFKFSIQQWRKIILGVPFFGLRVLKYSAFWFINSLITEYICFTLDDYCEALAGDDESHRHASKETLWRQ